MGDRYAIVCNVHGAGLKYARPGARCMVARPNEGWCGERLQLLVRSRSGRFVLHWEPIERIENFRVVTVPEAASVRHREKPALWETRGQAEEVRAMLLQTKAHRSS